MVKPLFHLFFRSSHHLYSLSLSRVKMNSINWPAPNIWVFIAQLVEHCGASAEAMGSNPVEALKICNCLNCDYNCDGQIFISFVFPQFTSSLMSILFIIKTPTALGFRNYHKRNFGCKNRKNFAFKVKEQTDPIRNGFLKALFLLISK